MECWIMLALLFMAHNIAIILKALCKNKMLLQGKLDPDFMNGKLAQDWASGFMLSRLPKGSNI